ncbi:unnamed protein product [Urochloa humidicola]
MHLFLSKFRELQTNRKSDESQQNYATEQVTRKLMTKLPIESHANKVYTKAMYLHFTDQLLESGSFIVKNTPSPTEFILLDTRLEHTTIARDIHVTLEGENYIHCECGLYQHMGMLCRHAIKVLTNLDRREIPANNIHKRWTRLFDEGNNNNDYLTQLGIDNDELKKKALINKAFELVNRQKKISNFSFEQTMEALTQACTSSTTEPESTDDNSGAINNLSENIPTSCPPSAFKGGRSPNTSLKSWQESMKKQAKQKTREAEKQACDWPREENPPTKKRRSINEIMKP